MAVADSPFIKYVDLKDPDTVREESGVRLGYSFDGYYDSPVILEVFPLISTRMLSIERGSGDIELPPYFINLQ